MTVKRTGQTRIELNPTETKKDGMNTIQLGQVLVRAGRLDARDLEQALKDQGTSNKRIGEILIERGFIKPEELTHGLNVQSMLSASRIPTGLSLGSVLEGQTSQAGESVKATKPKAGVPIRSHLAVLYQTPAIAISRADIKVGYVILENVTRLAIKSNNKKGCMVVFQGLKWPFKEAHVFGFAKDIHITPEGGTFQQPYKKKTHHVELSYRFILSENAKAGKHPWPLSIAIQPL